MSDERHREILSLARHAGRVTVEDLAARLAVTPQTIRRDLNDMARRSLLSRVHGGAIVTSGVDNIDYAARRDVAATAKAAIGAAAARLIPDGASLFINIGTTTEAVAANLPGHRDLMVISNNLNVVDMLDGRDSIDVVVVGGKVRRGDRAVVGPLAMSFIDAFKVDVALIGASAIDPDGSLLDFAADEVQVTQTIVRNARQVILVADSGKIGRPAPLRIGRLDMIDWLVTDRLTDDRLRRACADHDVRVVEAFA
ncbi:DeoR family transcriptional regulator [Sphingomonas ginsenosidimutans]|jgi:DeoR family glycerol-3-phosphate regulon repressor|uniref:DeoR family transcriptional regulator n=1 Tax=Sphingomonas ginsenosidimutans TaxID=862134 RepID=A0A2A4HTE9_9SPHN|nr:DeoR/GlpR family DNA-binding transcription regulator [Sphingomonas ginsenosidimutans]MEE2915954.1 DeoR/GlpR family DNA-binding transcription regulator [Pseudomonadota bacterium]PCG07806.1 DeoR family transcriptional regulator [Sphingomonas ginsenosidimutans]